MEIKLEAKTLAIGILLGAILTIALGAESLRDRTTGRLIDTSTVSGNADKTDFGLAVGQDAMALIRVQNGDFFIVNPKNGMAYRVLRSGRLADEPTNRNRDSRAKPFNYTESGAAEETNTTGGYGK